MTHQYIVGYNFYDPETGVAGKKERILKIRLPLSGETFTKTMLPGPQTQISRQSF
jgi:hypothetical protein